MKASPPEPAPPPKSVEREQKGGSAQDASGQNDPAHAAPEPNSARTAESGAQNAQQKSGLSAPVPAEPARTSKESIMTVAEAEGLARANDIPACRDAGRQLRLAGVAMPSPLLPLIALDLPYQQKNAPPYYRCTNTTRERQHGRAACRERECPYG